MPLFDYSAKTKQLKTVHGSVEAKSVDDAAEILNEQGLSIIDIKEQEIAGLIVQKATGIFNGVSKKDLAIMLRQLSILISSAIPLVQALKMLVDQMQKRKLKEALLNIANDIDAGTKFSDALAGYPAIFKPFFINMVKSGETTGKLDEILTYLADQQEKDYELESKIKGAMLYPAFIFSALLGVGVFVMVYVVPSMLELFQGVDQSHLPLATKILIAVTYVSQNYWYLFIIGIAGLVGGGMWYLRTSSGKMLWGKTQVKIPGFGSLLKNIVIVKFARSFQTVLVGGLTVTEGLLIVRDVIGNPAHQKVLDETIKSVEDGNPIASVMTQHPGLFPPMVSQMLSVGEETGRLEEVLQKVTEFYTREVNIAVESILVIIEPVVIVLLGFGVLVIVAGVLLPMYQLATEL